MPDLELTIGSGAVGGKAAGFFRAKKLLETKALGVRFPKSACVTTEIFDTFLRENHLEELLVKYRWEEEGAYEELKSRFLAGSFSTATREKLERLLQYWTFPLAVRSSSLLEDRPGTSFAGKYLTVFISNRGTLEERLDQLLAAMRQVFASAFNPNALQYRKRRKLLSQREEMAILLQEAIGREYEGYFLPLIAGVGFSQNGFCWTREIKKEEGIVRLVFGLGTRAVGRGYARIFSPGKPTARPEGTDANAIRRFSQEIIDALDLQKNAVTELRAQQLVRDGFDCYPHAQRLFSLKAENYLYLPSTHIWEKGHQPVLTFDGILGAPLLGLDLPAVMRHLFQELEALFGTPVDVEFAIRAEGEDFEEACFYLVQCRELSQREDQKPLPIPSFPREKKILEVSKQVPTASLSDIEYVVYVDPERYNRWPAQEKFAVARMVGKINRELESKVFALMGPGRWGTINPSLGVPVKYSEISNARMLVEIATQEGACLPEVSYGTHFFQDLIEGGVVYVPLFPGEAGTYLNREFLEQGEARLRGLIRIIHIPSVSGGCLARAVFNGVEEKGVMGISATSGTPASRSSG